MLINIRVLLVRRILYIMYSSRKYIYIIYVHDVN